MPKIVIEPATADRFADAEHVLTGGGDGRSCQCQWWTISNKQFTESSQPDKESLLRGELAHHPSPGHSSPTSTAKLRAG